MTTAFSQPWPSEPPAFSFDERPAQFTVYEDYYQEYEPDEHMEDEPEPEPQGGIYELAKHLGASDEEAEHLERIFNDAGGHKPVEQVDPASLQVSQEVPHHIADWHNKSWVRQKPDAVQHWPQ